MKKLTTKEVNKIVVDKLLFENDELINKIKSQLDDICINRKYDVNVEKLANELFVNAIQVKEWLPIQSFIGMIYKKFADDTLENRANVFDMLIQIVIDYGLLDDSVILLTYSKNNHLMMKGKYISNDFIKNVNLPYTEPITGAIAFGSIKNRTVGSWVGSINMLNKQEFVLDKTTVKYFKFDKEWSKERVDDEKRRMEILNELEDSSSWYFHWGTDYRGRVYCSGDTLNAQGDDFRKSLLRYRDRELTEDGLLVLKTKIAAAFGLDKESKFKQYTWFIRNENRLEELIDKADDRYEYIALTSEYRKYKRTGKCGAIVGVDAPQSQLQILALILKSKKIAEASNLIGDEKQDNYKRLADAMNEFINVGFTRNEVKYMLMTFGYGAGDNRLNQIAKRDIHPEKLEKVKQAQMDIVLLFKAALKKILPGLEDTLKEVNNLWEAKGFSYTMPDGFKVNVWESNDEYFTGVYDVNGEPKEIKFKVDGIVLNKKYSLLPFVSIVHSIDAYIAREMIRRANRNNIEIYTIHDDFRVHPNDAQLVINEYRKIFQELLENDIAYDILYQAFGLRIDKNRGDLKSDDINGRYILF